MGSEDNLVGENKARTFVSKSASAESDATGGATNENGRATWGGAIEEGASTIALRSLLAATERVSPRAAAWLAEQVFVRPRRHARPDREKALLASGERLAIAYAGESLAAWSWGEGATVLLVHGWEGRGAQLGAFVPPLVAAGHRVVAFDAPAHGDSPGGTATIVTLAGAIESATEQLGPVTAVIAHSLGAAATTIALGQGARVERAVYLAPVFDVAGAVARFAAYVGLSPETLPLFRERLLARTGRAPEDLGGVALVGSLAQPALIFHDVADPEVPPSDGAALATAWPGARLRATEELGHRRILRDARVVAEAVAFTTAGTHRPRSLEETLSEELFDPELRRARAA